MFNLSWRVILGVEFLIFFNLVSHLYNEDSTTYHIYVCVYIKGKPVSHLAVSSIASRFFTNWTTREAQRMDVAKKPVGKKWILIWALKDAHGLTHFISLNAQTLLLLLFFFKTKPLKVQKASQECGNDDHVIILSFWLPCKRERKKMHSVSGGDRVAGLLVSHSWLNHPC